LFHTTDVQEKSFKQEQRRENRMLVSAHSGLAHAGQGDCFGLEWPSQARILLRPVEVGEQTGLSTTRKKTARVVS
jgi:hypothetical protein